MNISFSFMTFFAILIGAGYIGISLFFENKEQWTFMRYTRCIYYSCSIIWILFFCAKDNVIVLSIEKNEPIIANSFFRANLLIIIFWFVATILIDVLIVSCSSIKSFKFKDFELSIIERKKTNLYSNNVEEENNTLKEIIRLQPIMTAYIDGMFTNEKKVVVNYEMIISKYSVKRSEIKLYHFVYSEEISLNRDLEKRIQGKINSKNINIGTVIYTILSNQYCLLQISEEEMALFFIIETTYAVDNYIIVITGKSVASEEVSAIADFIHYYEMKIENELRTINKS